MAVHISLLGVSEATHDSITGIQGSFRKATDAASRLATAGTHVVMKATLLKQNFDEFHKMEAFAKNLGAELSFSPVVFPKSTGEKTPTVHRLDDDQMREIYAYSFGDYRTEIVPERDIGTLPLCQFGRTDCCINPLGKVYPCVAVPLEVGDLKKQKFSDIWEHSEILKKIRCSTMGNLIECYKCSLLPSCVRCSGMALLEEGDMFSVPHECCRMARIMEEVI
jgi:radical SAM protein with 4Fe4S-binding SPASM domain